MYMYVYSLPDSLKCVILYFLFSQQRMTRIYRMITGGSGRSVMKQATQIIHTEDLAQVISLLATCSA